MTRQQSPELDERWAEALEPLGYERAPRRMGLDFWQPERGHALEVKFGQRMSLRDVRAAATTLALALQRDRRMAHATLVLNVSRLTRGRLAREWEELIALFDRSIASRLALVALGDDYELVLPETADHLRELVDIGRGVQAAAGATRGAAGPKWMAVLKLLLVHHLRGTGPITRRQLGAEAGCSYPTISAALRRFGRSIERWPDRRIELRSFPRDAWTELLVRAPVLRSGDRFADRSGRPADPARLLRRLETHAPPGVAVGGVAAARHWDPALDLHGMPRVDLLVHRSSQPIAEWVRALDAALAPVADDERGSGAAPVLVVRRLHRPISHFELRDGAVPIADPIETVLDLHDLGLTPQAEALIAAVESGREANP